LRQTAKSGHTGGHSRCLIAPDSRLLTRNVGSTTMR